jgi:hypothetical protein
MSDERENVQLQTGGDTVEVHTSLLIVVGSVLLIIGAVLTVITEGIGVSSPLLVGLSILCAVAGGVLLILDLYLFPDGHHPDQQ